MNRPASIETVDVTPAEWPPSNADFDFYYQGIRERRLLIQRCAKCAAFRFPPGPMCARCNSLTWSSYACSGRGLVYTYTIHHRPPVAPFPSPHPIVLVELEEGVRMAGAFAGVDVRIGLPVEIEYIDGPGGIVFPRFRRWRDL